MSSEHSCSSLKCLSTLVTSDQSLPSHQNVSDASYAYKLKREKVEGPTTPSQQLNEIIDNVSACGELYRQATFNMCVQFLHFLCLYFQIFYQVNCLKSVSLANHL